MRKKRFLAVVLSSAMVLGSVVTASAGPVVDPNSKPLGTQTTVTGQGDVTGLVNENIFNVVVPTTVSEGSIFDYILDPQGLIEASGGAKYISGANLDGVKVSINETNGFTASSLYFVNSANDAADPTKKKLTNTSDPYIIKNKSTMAVDISVNATLTGGSGITVSTDKTFNGSKDKNTSMYMEILFGSANTGKTISGANPAGTYMAKHTFESAKKFYVKSVSTDGTAKYEIPSANEAANASQYPSYSFKLTGACNTDADWSNVTSPTAPQVDVVYYLTEHKDVPAAPSIATTTYTIQQNQPVNVNVDLGGGDLAASGIAEITYLNSSNVQTTLTTDKYSFADGTLTFTSTYINALYGSLSAPRVYTITFNDDAATQVEVTLQK